MGLLDQITKMRQEGQTDEEIASQLKQRGISPREINEAFSQAQIKNAVSDEDYKYQAPPQSYGDEQNTSANYSPRRQEISEGDTYTPQPSGYQNQQYPQNQQDYGYYPGQDAGYDYQQSYSGGTSTSTMIEISEQVFSEKIETIRKKMEEMNEFKTLSETKIQNISDRLKRIETIVDKLQISILDKIGSYGDNLESIKKETSMMQDSFRKMINPILEHKEKKQPTKKTKTKKKTSKKKS